MLYRRPKDILINYLGHGYSIHFPFRARHCKYKPTMSCSNIHTYTVYTFNCVLKEGGIVIFYIREFFCVAPAATPLSNTLLAFALVSSIYALCLVPGVTCTISHIQNEPALNLRSKGEKFLVRQQDKLL